jgi:hypothetical protein
MRTKGESYVLSIAAKIDYSTSFFDRAKRTARVAAFALHATQSGNLELLW